MTTWRKEILQEMTFTKETWDQVVAKTITDKELDQKFDDHSAEVEGIAFTVWTVNFVYFPACYQGTEWCDSVPRNPCDEGKFHVGASS